MRISAPPCAVSQSVAVSACRAGWQKHWRDSGAPVAIERRNRRAGAMLRCSHAAEIDVATSAGCVVQTWRDGARQALLSRALGAFDVRVLDASAARETGRTLAAARSSDIVNAHIACISESGDKVLSSDPDDIATLLTAVDVAASVVTI